MTKSDKQVDKNALKECPKPLKRDIIDSKAFSSSSCPHGKNSTQSSTSKCPASSGSSMLKTSYHGSSHPSYVCSYKVSALHSRTWPVRTEFYGAMLSKKDVDPHAILLVRIKLPRLRSEEAHCRVASLPKATSKWEVYAEDHYVYSIEGLNRCISNNAKFASLKPLMNCVKRLEVITPPRECLVNDTLYASRFGPITLYFAYLTLDPNDAPSFYFMQGNDSWGNKSDSYIPVVYEGKNLLPIHKQFVQNVVGVPYTPMTTCENVYRATVRMRSDDPNEPEKATVMAYTPTVYASGNFSAPENMFKVVSGKARPYLTISMGFCGIAASTDFRYDPVTLSLEAAGRAGAIQLAINRHAHDSGYKVAAPKYGEDAFTQFELGQMKLIWNASLVFGPAGLTFNWKAYPNRRISVLPGIGNLFHKKKNSTPNHCAKWYSEFAAIMKARANEMAKTENNDAHTETHNLLARIEHTLLHAEESAFAVLRNDLDDENDDDSRVESLVNYVPSDLNTSCALS